MAVSYLRILSTVTHPGYTEQGSPTAATPLKPTEEAPVQHDVFASCASTKVQEGTNQGDKKPQRAAAPPSPPVSMLDVKAILSGEVPPPPGTEQFYSKEVFACDQNGLPIWCGVCNNWKPDRSHHGSDFGRCVWKMDHFCPWVSIHRHRLKRHTLTRDTGWRCRCRAQLQFLHTVLLVCYVVCHVCYDRHGYICCRGQACSK